MGCLYGVHGAPKQAFNVVMNEKCKGDYNIHSEVCMNTLCIFPVYVLHMHIDMDESIRTWMNVDE
jgi:hypothetical protein